MLAGLRPANMNGALETGIVKCMQRLAQLEHHVIGDIDQRADGANPAALDTLAQPVRRSCSGIDTTDHPAAVPRTCLGRIEDNCASAFDGREHGLTGGRGIRSAGKCGDLAGDTCEAQAIGPVRCELDRKRDIIERQIITNVVADGCARGQLKQPPMVLRQPQFARRTKHSERFDTPQFCSLDLEPRKPRTDQRTRNHKAGRSVRRPANNLQGLADTRIHATDAKFVGVRMLLHLDDSGDHNAGKGGSDRFDLLDLQARHSQQMTQSLCIEGRIHKAPQPAL